MTKNVGFKDKIIRIVLAVILFSLYFVLEGKMKYLAVIGFVPFLTGLISRCPLYSLLGLNSCPINQKK